MALHTEHGIIDPKNLLPLDRRMFSETFTKSNPSPWGVERINEVIETRQRIDPGWSDASTEIWFNIRINRLITPA